MVLKKPSDFPVEECVTHFYEKDGHWFWHCMTCNTGSGKRHKHLNGHKNEGDAAVATKYHRNAKRLERQQKLYRAWWWKEIMTTKDLDYFIKLWQSHWGVMNTVTDPEDIMASVQSDNHLWTYMVKINGQGNGSTSARHDGANTT